MAIWLKFCYEYADFKSWYPVKNMTKFQEYKTLN